MTASVVQEQVSLESLVGRVADEFLQRQERGERPDVEAYAARYPDAAPVLRKVLAALALLERSLTPTAVPALMEDRPVAGILGDFRILREVGRGGMGVVYEAEQISLGRRVALKVLPFAATLDPKQLQRFKNEAQAAAHLQHTNIVPVYYVGCERGVHFFAMQYIEGQTLAQAIADLRLQIADLPKRADGRKEWPSQLTPANDQRTLAGSKSAIPPVIQSLAYFRTVANWGIQAAEALEHAHRQGVIHRDIKPANLLVERRAGSVNPPVLWITDFGLAHCQNHPGLTRTGDLVGTLRYMSPERVLGKGETLDARTDVYSLGATLYELLTLEPAYDGRNREQLLHQIAFDEPRPPSRLNDAVPVDLQTIVLKAMAKSPEERYATAQELADDLRHFLAGEPIRARPATAWERAVKWTRRRPAVAALLAVSIAALLSLFGGTLWYNAQLSIALTEANTNLYSSVVSQASAIRRARENGYRDEAFSLLKQALAIETPKKDLLELRQEAAACLGDFVGLEPTTWDKFPAQIGSAALHPDGTLLAVSFYDGRIQLRRIPDGAVVAELLGHSYYVACLAFRAGGKELVSVDGTGMIKVWHANRDGTWECRRTLLVERTVPLVLPSLAFPFFTTTQTTWCSPSPLARLASASLTSDGRYLAASWSHSTVALVNLGKGTARQFPVPNGEEISALAVSPDGKLLAGAYEHQGAHGILVWEVRTRALQKKIKLELEPVAVYCLGFSPDSKLLVCTHTEGVAVYDTSTLESRPFERGDLPTGVAFSPDSQLLAYQANNLRSIRLWDFRMNRYIGALKCRSAFWVEFSKDGKLLVAVTSELVRIWNLAGASEKRVLKGHAGAVLSVVFRPDGKILVTAGRDHKIKIWDPVTCTLLKELEFLTTKEGLSFSPDGRVLAVGSHDNGTVRFYDVESWEVLNVLSAAVGDEVLSTCFSPDRQYFAAGGSHGLTVWRAVRGAGEQANKTTISFQPYCRLTEKFSDSICFSPDSHWLAWLDDAGEDGFRAVHVWDLRTMQPHDLSTAKICHLVKSLGFTPDSRHLTFVNDKLAIAVWDVATKQEVVSFGEVKETWEARPRTHLSADGAWYAVADQTVTIWDMNARELLVTLSPERSAVCTVGQSAIFSIGWSPDCKLLVVGAFDGSLEIWDLPRINAKLAEFGLGW